MDSNKLAELISSAGVKGSDVVAPDAAVRLTGFFPLELHCCVCALVDQEIDWSAGS